VTCDPNTLSQLSSCLRCLTDAQLQAVRTYLLCQWANIAGNAIDMGYSIPIITIGSGNPIASTTYFFGADSLSSIQTTYALAAVTVVKAGTIKGAYIKARITTPGSAELATHSIIVNNLTSQVIATGAYNANSLDINNNAMSLAVNAGDTIAMKLDTPAWVTAPLTVRWEGYVVIQ
jgi:hypothetical protein